MNPETNTASTSDAGKSTGKNRKKTPTTRAPKGETTAEKFQRLAPPRVEAALKKISLIGNLSGSGYSYEASEAKQIIDALKDAVEEVANKFSRSKQGGKSGFAFKR